MARRPRRRQQSDQPTEPQEGVFEENVVKIKRCAKVVKGGRRFSFSALVVVGDRKGTVGCGFGKANEVPLAVQKGIQDGKKNVSRIAVDGSTIPHEVIGKFGSSVVLMFPAPEGTGVIAGGSVRAVCELVGIKNILTKAHGPTNPINVVKATVNGLKQLRTLEQTERLRGVKLA